MSLNSSTIKSNLGIPSPPEDLKVHNPTLWTWLKRLVDSLNEWVTTTATTINQRPQVGLAANLPPISPGYQGRFYFEYDTNILFIDNGQGQWIPINGSSTAPIFTSFVEPFGSSPFTVPGQNSMVFASASPSADFIVNLPPATGSDRLIVVKKMDANMHSVDVTPSGSDTIDDSNSPVDITIQYDAIRLIDYAAGKWAIW